MKELESIICEIGDMRPEWIQEAEELGVDKDMQDMADFLLGKLEGRS